ncbi:MAG: hypothetical protein R3D66_00900 [Alphaproteobacteria bacterium]
MQKNLEAGLALYSLKRSPDFTVKPITPEVMAKKIQAILEGDDIFELQSDELETALQELGQSVEHGSQRVGVLFNDAVKTGIPEFKCAVFCDSYLRTGHSKSLPHVRATSANNGPKRIFRPYE